MLARANPVLLAALAIAALCVMDALIKHATGATGVLAVAFWRYFFGAIVAGGVWIAAGRPRITGEMWRAHGLRGIIAAGAGVTFFYALSTIPLAEAITLGFIAPLLIPFTTWAILGERVRPEAVVAGLVGFAGAAIAAQGLAADGERSAEYLYGIASVLVSALLYAVTMALLRQRAGKDGAPIVGLMQALVPMLAVAVPAFALDPLPAPETFPWLAAIGACGALGWWLMIQAYARAEAQRLAPLEFTALIWASIFGFVFFAEVPRPQVFAGAAIIIAAVSYGEWAARRASARVAD